MEAKRLADLGQESIDNEDTNVAHVLAASITTTNLFPLQVNSSAPDLSDDELVTLKLKEKNESNDSAPMLTLPKGKVNENDFEECMKSSKPIAPIPSGSTEQMFQWCIPCQCQPSCSSSLY